MTHNWNVPLDLLRGECHFWKDREKALCLSFLFLKDDPIRARMIGENSPHVLYCNVTIESK